MTLACNKGCNNNGEDDICKRGPCHQLDPRHCMSFSYDGQENNRIVILARAVILQNRYSQPC